jgi:hypothetical protein
VVSFFAAIAVRSYVVAWAAGVAFAASANLHVIRVVDETTRRGVPLVELCTTSSVCFITDSQGIIALNEPAYWNRQVFFSVRSHGYEHAPDFFGEPGTPLLILHGGSSIVRVKRKNIAERLYRVTGEGIYRDSLLAGARIPIREPAINAKVTGLDTVMHALYRGRLFWLFGDTESLSSSLGNLATTCARSDLPGQGGLDPETGIDLRYFTGRDGSVKPMASAITGPGLKWLFALMVVRDGGGVERLLARYDLVKSLTENYESRLAVFDDAAGEFKRLVSFGKSPALSPHGRPTRVLIGSQEYFYFTWPHATPVVRVRAEWSAIQDLSQYEAMTCSTGECKWVRGASPEKTGFFDVDTGDAIDGTACSVYWNAFRRRWIAIIQKNVGQVWYAEADTPSGPWAYAKKIIDHDQYTFYWPGQIPYFDRDGGRRIYIMGTYTQSFSDAPVKTPRYDYNQIMYALSLDDSRLDLPVARYAIRGRTNKLQKQEIDRLGLWEGVESVADFIDKQGRVRPNPAPQSMFDQGAQPITRTAR